MFKCDECSLQFKLKGNFKRHKKTHNACPFCTLKFYLRSGLLRHMSDTHGIGAYHRPKKRQVTAQNNVSHDRVRHSCDLCTSTFSLLCNLSRHKRNIHGINTNLRRVAQVPDIRSSGPDTIDMNDILYNLLSHNPLGVVRQNENVYDGCTLRKLHEEYEEAQHSEDKRLVWESLAGSLSRNLKLDMKVISMLMLDIYADYSPPIDENLIQMLHQDSLFCVENIQHNTQYYIFVQLVYGLMKIYEMGVEDLQAHRKSNWLKNTNTILEYFEFTDDTADFMIERMNNFI